MAITYPREMICGVETVDFELTRYLSRNLLYGGLTQVREQAEPRWRATFTYAAMRRTQFQALQAWLDSLRGGLKDFLAYDPLKPFPVSYKGGFDGLSRAGGGAFDGTGPAASLTTNGFTVSTLPASFALKAGDMVGLVEGAKRALFRIVEDATANGSGVVTLNVEPRIVSGQFTAAAVANFTRPACLMTLDPGSISSQRTARVRSPISFAGIQKIY